MILWKYLNSGQFHAQVMQGLLCACILLVIYTQHGTTHLQILESRLYLQAKPVKLVHQQRSLG